MTVEIVILLGGTERWTVKVGTDPDAIMANAINRRELECPNP